MRRGCLKAQTHFPAVSSGGLVSEPLFAVALVRPFQPVSLVPFSAPQRFPRLPMVSRSMRPMTFSPQSQRRRHRAPACGARSSPKRFATVAFRMCGAVPRPPDSIAPASPRTSTPSSAPKWRIPPMRNTTRTAMWRVPSCVRVTWSSSQASGMSGSTSATADSSIRREVARASRCRSWAARGTGKVMSERCARRLPKRLSRSASAQNDRLPRCG